MSAAGRRRTLTRAEVVDTALEIVDSEGLEALTMRRLGAALGVEAMALYRHVANKEALLDLTVERMRSEMELGSLDEGRPMQVLETIFAEYRRVLAAHPNLLPLAARRTDHAATTGLQYLIDHGLAPDDAVGLYQSLIAFTLGYSLLGSAALETDWTGLPDELTARLADWRASTFRRTIRAVMAGYGITGEEVGS